MSYFQEQYDKPSPEQKRYIYDRDRLGQMGRCFSNSVHYYNVAPAVNTPPEVNRDYNKENRVSMNHIENEVAYLLKNVHTHSKKSKEYNKYTI